MYQLTLDEIEEIDILEGWLKFINICVYFVLVQKI